MKFDDLPDEAFIRLAVVLELVPVARSQLYNWIAAGKFPAPVPLGHRSVAWRVGVIRQWLREHEDGV
jgi:prophage regulatory protein